MEPGLELELITDLPLRSLSKVLIAEARMGFLLEEETGVGVLVQSENGSLFLLASIFVCVCLFSILSNIIKILSFRLCIEEANWVWRENLVIRGEIWIQLM